MERVEPVFFKEFSIRLDFKKYFRYIFYEHSQLMVALAEVHKIF